MQHEFTPAAQRAINAAAEWFICGGPEELDAPSLLMGLLTESECRAAIMLARCGIDAEAVRRQWPQLAQKRRQIIRTTNEIIREARRAAGLTQTELAERLGCQQTHVSQWERGKHVCATDTMLRIADACGVSMAITGDGWQLLPADTNTSKQLTPKTTALGNVSFSKEVESSLQTAGERFGPYQSPLELATEHLLLGLAFAEHDVARWLRRQGLDPDALEAEIHQLYGHRPEPLAVEGDEWNDLQKPPETVAHAPTVESARVATADFPCSGPTPAGEGVSLLRILDASANRAREGLRVVEDYVRFAMDDPHLTGLCKQLRHDIAAVLGRVATEQRLAARETQADVGTELTTASEQARGCAAGVLTANLVRLQESLRSLEEFGKLIDADMAAALKQLRYHSYTLQRAVEITRSSLRRLDKARLYVLVDGRATLETFRQLVGSLVEAGVHMIQLRDKRLDDRCLLERARALRKLTSESATLFIMNDRADLAVLSHADGVHVGQEELSVKDARAIVGAEALIGVSTHSIEQAKTAVLDGANYIGVGPTFLSGTKRFDEFPGVELLKTVATEIRLPAFAIGGITQENLPEVLAARFTRIAVGGAVVEADDPAASTRSLLRRLGAVEIG